MSVTLEQSRQLMKRVEIFGENEFSNPRIGKDQVRTASQIATNVGQTRKRSHIWKDQDNRCLPIACELRDHVFKFVESPFTRRSSRVRFLCFVTSLQRTLRAMLKLNDKNNNNS